MLLTGAVIVLFLRTGPAADARQGKLAILKVGASSATSKVADRKKEEAAMQTLRSFIKEETGLDNQIIRQKDWLEVAENLAKGQLQLGAFEGFEFAWAQEKYPDLKPLALAVNVHRYPVAFIMTKKDSPVTDFAGLQGKTLAMPAADQRILLLFLENQCQAKGKKLDEFFSKVVSPENIEDALDDVVDGVVDAVAADQATLEAFKRRKPGRYNRLKEVAHSEPMPPGVVAYYGTALDDATVARFRDGLMGASRKAKGEQMLTLFRLTGFETIPEDFVKVLAQTRKSYPPPNPVDK
jgi:ABC-type phosphate/phosphonate transport system substrate-binding protein